MARYLNVKYEYSKLRKRFGRQTLFQHVPGHIVDSINPDPVLQKQYCLRNPVNREVQASMIQSEHSANTKVIVTTETGVNHAEGGWPKEIHVHNEEHVFRHRRRITHEENYVHAVTRLAPTMKHYVDQNNAIEMYQSYFRSMPAQEPVEKHSIKVINVYRDKSRRPVSCIVWTNEKHSKLVVSYCDQKYPSESCFNNECCIWDIHHESDPILEIYPEDTCWQLACSPVEPEVLAAGLENGTVKLFDIREGPRPVSGSSIYNSHRSPVTSLLYTQSRTQKEFFTGSIDGQCLFWDGRNLSEPTERLVISVRLAPKQEPNLENSEGVSSLQYDKGFPTKFLVGTESGLIINVNRMGKTHSEMMTCYWNAHNGPVRAVHRSPCTFRMFLSCGDRDVKIWSEEVRSQPIILTKPNRFQVTDATWAPFRYSSFMAICEGGTFHYWDLLRRHYDPIVTLHVSSYALTKLRPHHEGTLIAVGDINGSVFLAQQSDNMVYASPKDRSLMAHTYQRETKREHILEARFRELHLKKKQEASALRLEPSVAFSTKTTEEEDEFKAVEENYFKIINQEINKLV